MAREPEPKRGMPRSLLYALIPLGFVLLVAWMVLSGRDSAETAGEAAVETNETVPAPVDGAPGTQETQDPIGGTTAPAN
ncbi:MULTISPECIES: hypothetical protein [Paracoccus]|uniref:Uncharacterized protein n=1 Tax=Paracoccus aerius TaxID=1915382 RepID=A0ABS1S887_9RHOB|nr:MULTISPECIES: hypothetical protein [Paracoccus]MBL3674759.1 hypothetical protein [Paracoccus aerius]QIR84660.1 hypothetical protein FIU66_05210 [Paracoccus sp. AK26]GHG28547.1 hypothetical protein GCM10017322_28860 [Paracoccus aerius]